MLTHPVQKSTEGTRNQFSRDLPSFVLFPTRGRTFEVEATTYIETREKKTNANSLTPLVALLAAAY